MFRRRRRKRREEEEEEGSGPVAGEGTLLLARHDHVHGRAGAPGLLLLSNLRRLGRVLADVEELAVGEEEGVDTVREGGGRDLGRLLDGSEQRGRLLGLQATTLIARGR